MCFLFVWCVQSTRSFSGAGHVYTCSMATLHYTIMFMLIAERLACLMMSFERGDIGIRCWTRQMMADKSDPDFKP